MPGKGGLQHLVHISRIDGPTEYVSQIITAIGSVNSCSWISAADLSSKVNLTPCNQLQCRTAEEAEECLAKGVYYTLPDDLVDHYSQVRFYLTYSIS